MRGRKVELRHEREDANGKKERRCERAEEPQSRPGSDEQVACNNSPRDEDGGFVEIVDRAAFQRKTALEHGRGVKDEAEKQQQIISPVVFAESFAEEKNRVRGAEAVSNYGDEETMSVSKPSHAVRLMEGKDGARRKSEWSADLLIGSVLRQMGTGRSGDRRSVHWQPPVPLLTVFSPRRSCGWWPRFPPVACASFPPARRPCRWWWRWRSRCRW